MRLFSVVFDLIIMVMLIIGIIGWGGGGGGAFCVLLSAITIFPMGNIGLMFPQGKYLVILPPQYWVSFIHAVNPCI